jgi:hypothetical protein
MAKVRVKFRLEGFDDVSDWLPTLNEMFEQSHVYRDIQGWDSDLELNDRRSMMVDNEGNEIERALMKFVVDGEKIIEVEKDPQDDYEWEDEDYIAAAKEEIERSYKNVDIDFLEAEVLS